MPNSTPAASKSSRHYKQASASINSARPSLIAAALTQFESQFNKVSTPSIAKLASQTPICGARSAAGTLSANAGSCRSLSVLAHFKGIFGSTNEAPHGFPAVGVVSCLDDVVSLPYPHRHLNAYYPHNFGASIATKCFRSSMYSPYRLYSTSITTGPDISLVGFQLSAGPCPVPGAACCSANLEKLVIRTAGTPFNISGVVLDGVNVPFTISELGVTLTGLAMTPSMPISRVTLITNNTGTTQTGSDTAFNYHLVLLPMNTTLPDSDGPENGTCSTMDLRDLEVSIYNHLAVKSVMVNGSLFDWTATQNSPDSVWLTLPLSLTSSDFSPLTPLDVVIVVRGKVDTLCPASEFLMSSNACEYAMHGQDGPQACCPHSVTFKSTPPPSDCCQDDLQLTPYRVRYITHMPSRTATTYFFDLTVVPTPAGVDTDGTEVEVCTTMTLDWAQIHLYSSLVVTSVTWDGRVLPFNTTPATSTSQWLNIHNVNRYFSDFDSHNPVSLAVTFQGWINEPCPAQPSFNSQQITCEYALHGHQSTTSCCPHGLTTSGPAPGGCGCRDDLSETPYRIMYTSETTADDESTTTFNFNLALVDSSMSQDFDGVDSDLNAEVNCSAMGIRDLKLAIFSSMEVVEVSVNNAVLDWQLTPNTPYSQWLWLLGVDYAMTDLQPYQPVPLKVVVRGGGSDVTELCPASSVFGSASSCEYIVTGTSGPGHAECCPKGVSSYYTPQRLRLLETNA
ncbi:predicted protein [Haematococcus lacustris]|uniref:Pherophorin domain-containing protein n=1 Tax=Haematococcus lacustris TaxID=44745 RepID=A0A699Y822_HAELA|nr:predicted protein [Haematococcus lacustris]